MVEMMHLVVPFLYSTPRFNNLNERVNMKRINRKQIKSTAKYNKPHDGIGRLLTSTPGAIIGLIKQCSIVLITFIPVISAIICSHSTYATASTISLTIDNSTVSMSVSPTNVNGSFNKSSVSTVSASTDNATGYTLSIAAPSGSGADYDKLINGSDNTAKLNSISSATTEEQFKALNNTSYNGKWGYLPSKYHSQDNSDFLPAPTTAGDILDQTSIANSTANTYSLAIGARVDSSIKTGAYSNSFVVKLVGNAIPYTMTFIDTTVSNMPIDIDTTSMTETVTLPSNTPAKNGYTFLGWCTVAPTNNTNGTDTCSGTTYQPSDAVTINQQSATNNFTFYAMWDNNYSITKLTYLQDFNYMSTEKKGKIALSMEEEHTYTLRDSRDNQEYTIAKLKDGNIWMTKNLNIAGGTAISCTTSDCVTGYTIPNNNNWQSGNRLPASSTSGFNADNYAFVYNSGSTTCNGSSPCYSYYSWDAATLGSGRSLSTQDTDAPYSICPKGWKLPTTRTLDVANWKAESDFYILAHRYGLEGDTTGEQNDSFYVQAGPGTAPNFLFTGAYSYGNFTLTDNYGGYWSSTSYGNSYAFILSMRSYAFSTTNDKQRLVGFAIRCLLR